MNDLEFLRKRLKRIREVIRLLGGRPFRRGNSERIAATKHADEFGIFDDVLKEKLTVREVEVVIYVCKGMSSREISEELFVVEKSVKFHLTRIYKKLGLKSRAELIVFTMRGVNERRQVIEDALREEKLLEAEEKRRATELPQGVRTC